MMQHKFRGAELDPVIRTWISNVLNEPIDRGKSFGEVFKDGVLLCKMLNKLKPGIVPKINTGKLPFHKMENIAKYIEAARKLGLGEDKLFTTPDLFDEKNIDLVQFSVYSLGIQAKAMGFNGPVMEILKPPEQINILQGIKESKEGQTKELQSAQTLSPSSTASPSVPRGDSILPSQSSDISRLQLVSQRSIQIQSGVRTVCTRMD